MRSPLSVRVRRASFRRGRRGVSPIIATILLVAITVVLAATLYVLLIPLIGHPSTSIVGNLSWGTTTPVTGGSGNPACAKGDYCWEITINTLNPNVGLAPSSLNLYVQNASGLTISASSWTFTFLTSTNSVFANASGPVAGSSGAGWTGSGSSDALTLAMDLWIDTGSSTGYSGQGGIDLWTVGVSGFTGSFETGLAT